METKEEIVVRYKIRYFKLLSKNTTITSLSCQYDNILSTIHILSAVRKLSKNVFYCSKLKEKHFIFIRKLIIPQIHAYDLKDNLPLVLHSCCKRKTPLTQLPDQNPSPQATNNSKHQYIICIQPLKWLVKSKNLNEYH